MTMWLIAGLMGAFFLAGFLYDAYKREKSRNEERLKSLRSQIEAAAADQNLNRLKTIRLTNQSELIALDKGLSERLDQYIDDLYINQDDENEAAH